MSTSDDDKYIPRFTTPYKDRFDELNAAPFCQRCGEKMRACALGHDYQDWHCDKCSAVVPAHTTGRPRNTAERWHVDGEPEQDILIMDENRLVVATVMHGTDEQGEKAAQHTAALLAAAPRLADSVSALLEIVDRYVAVSATGANRQELEETIAEANAALNEALPETW